MYVSNLKFSNGNAGKEQLGSLGTYNVMIINVRLGVLLMDVSTTKSSSECFCFGKPYVLVVQQYNLVIVNVFIVINKLYLYTCIVLYVFIVS